jgi:hypothetical protein
MKTEQQSAHEAGAMIAPKMSVAFAKDTGVALIE